MSSDAERACEWHHHSEHAICDVVAPWDHGIVVRASRYPSYYDYNAVRVTGEPELSVPELARFADEQLGDLGHRRLDFDHIEAADARADEFAAAGWDGGRWLVMRHEGARPGPNPEVVAVDYDVSERLRMAWLREDFPDTDFGGFAAVAKEVALRLGAQTFAMYGDDGEAIAFAEVERDGPAAEVTKVYVDAAHRGRGLGTALTQAAMHAAGDVDDLWITADDDGRPKHLYARLGFRPAWRMAKFLRVG